MDRKKIKWTEQAVSEAIGYILILGIMITGIGLVTLYGYPILLQQQDNANILNMQQNFIVLQNNIKGLVYKNVPYEETSLQVSGGTLQVINGNSSGSQGQSHFDINYGGTPYGPCHTGLLEFQSNSNNDIIALQNGAVVTNGFSQTGGSSMLSEPRWFLDFSNGNWTLVITIVNINSTSPLSATGLGDVQMNVTEIGSMDVPPTTGQVVINYTDLGEGYTTAWHNFFNDTRVFPSKIATVGPSSITLNSINRLVIKNYTVTILNL